jgi:hypothetical protein
VGDIGRKITIGGRSQLEADPGGNKETLYAKKWLGHGSGGIVPG